VLADVRTVRAADGRPVLVHGGGPYIEAALAAAGVTSRFVRGLRVTTPEASGRSSAPSRCSASGSPPSSATRRADRPRRRAARGRAGRPRPGRGRRAWSGCAATCSTRCWPRPHAGRRLPRLDADGAPLNVNADDVAGAVAAALGAPCVFLTNVRASSTTRPIPAAARRADARRRRARIADGASPAA
jgi:acetylglutamate kinase